MQSTTIKHLPEEVRVRIYRWIGLESILPLLHSGRIFYYDAVISTQLFFDLYGPEHSLYDLIHHSQFRGKAASSRHMDQEIVGNPILPLVPAVALLGREDVLQKLLWVMFDRGLAGNASLIKTIQVFAAYQVPATNRESRLYGIVCGSDLARPALLLASHEKHSPIPDLYRAAEWKPLPIPAWHQPRILALSKWMKTPDNVDLAISTVQMCGNASCLKRLYQAILQKAYELLLHPQNAIDCYRNYHSKCLTCEDLAQLVITTPPSTQTWAIRAANSLRLSLEVKQECADHIKIFADAWNKSWNGQAIDRLIAVLSEVSDLDLAKLWVHIVLNCAGRYTGRAELLARFIDLQQVKTQSPSQPILFCLDAFRMIPLVEWHEIALKGTTSFHAVVRALKVFHPTLCPLDTWLRHPAGKKFISFTSDDDWEYENTKIWITEIYLPYRRLNVRVPLGLHPLLSKRYDPRTRIVHLEGLMDSWLQANESDRKYLLFSDAAIRATAIQSFTLWDEQREGETISELEHAHNELVCKLHDMHVNVMKQAWPTDLELPTEKGIGCNR